MQNTKRRKQTVEDFLARYGGASFSADALLPKKKESRSIEKLLWKNASAKIPVYADEKYLLNEKGKFDGHYREKAEYQNLALRIRAAIHAIGTEFTGKLVFTVIDEEYEDYLARTGKVNSRDVRRAYTSSLQIEDAARLWEKHPEFSIAYHSGAYIFCIQQDGALPEEMDYGIPEETGCRMTEELEEVFGPGNVWVSAQVTDMDSFLGERAQEAFYFDARNALAGRGKAKRLRYDTQIQKKGAEAMLLCVPFVVKEKMGCTIDTKTWSDWAVQQVRKNYHDPRHRGYSLVSTTEKGPGYRETFVAAAILSDVCEIRDDFIFITTGEKKKKNEVPEEYRYLLPHP